MNEYTSLQKYKSLTLYFRKGDVLLCVRIEWTQGRTAVLTQVLLFIIAALLSHLGWVALPWVTEGCKALSLQTGSHAGIPVSTEIVCLIPLYFGLFTLIHLLIDGSVEGQYITLSFYPFPHDTFYFIIA